MLYDHKLTKPSDNFKGSTVRVHDILLSGKSSGFRLRVSASDYTTAPELWRSSALSRHEAVRQTSWRVASASPGPGQRAASALRKAAITASFRR